MGNHRVAGAVTRGGGPQGSAPQHGGGPQVGGPQVGGPQFGGLQHGSGPQVGGLQYGSGPQGSAAQYSGPQHGSRPQGSAAQHGGGPRDGGPRYAGGATTTGSRFTGPRAPTLRNWPVSTRLIAVIVVALLMGLVFGGLRVASAADSADEFGRVSQLAELGQQITGLVQALENERDQTTGVLPVTDIKALNSYYNATNAAAAKVQSLASGVGGSFPANIQSRAATVIDQITHLKVLRSNAQASQSALAVIADYATPINDMIALNDLIAEGTSDAQLVNDVQTLNSVSLVKEQAAQQRALLYNAFQQGVFADGEQQALITAQSEQLQDQTVFATTATAAEQNSYKTIVNGPLVNSAQIIETYVNNLDTLAIGSGALGISSKNAPGQWYTAQSGQVNDIQQVETGIASTIVSRAQSLKSGAQSSALVTAIVTAVILLLVLLLTVAVARSLVGPLRRLREGALNIATVDLPERVRLLGEAQDPSTSTEVAPIDVLSTDEIGQVARAFDQVHSEAVRLAGNEAMLRNSFNAMFVNLSRRSQSLIERLVRMIDALEQNEGDPERLSNLFAMDHLVTRMRRNSENLLLLAGHENARKWSEPVSLADVARAAVSEIEQYSRVTLKIQPGTAVTGAAVSDVVHLLAEVIENATIFSAKDTPVHVGAQELTSGGILIEVSDNGVGIPEARLAEMNWRLDNSPVMDVSVSRHMGLFAVARLAERHGVRVRLRSRSPHGLTALVWLPEGVTEREASMFAPRSRPFAAQTGGFPSRGTSPAGHGTTPARVVPDGQPASHRRDVVVPENAGTGPRETIRASAGTASAGAASTGAASPGTASTGAASTGAASPGAASTGAAGTGTAPVAVPVTGSGNGSAATSGWFRSRASTTAAAGDGNGTAGPATTPSAGQPAGQGAGQPDGRGTTGYDGWSVGKHAAQIVAEPVRGDFTAAGLPTRVPQANLIPGSAGRAFGGRSAQPAGVRARGTGTGHTAIAALTRRGSQPPQRLPARGPPRQRPDPGRRRGSRPLSYAYRQDLNWLVTDFTNRVGDVAHAAVVSADGVPLALSEHIPAAFAGQLAAITSGLTSLMQGAARLFEAGQPTQALVEMEGGLMFVMAISDGSSLTVLAAPECDTDLVSYEMTLLVEAVGDVLTPASRTPHGF